MKHLKLVVGTAKSGDKTLKVGAVISVSDEVAVNYIKSGAWEDFTEQYEQVQESKKDESVVDLLKEGNKEVVAGLPNENTSSDEVVVDKKAKK